MKNISFKKLGISMVALVITIIVLIILTAAVVITGVNAPKQAQLAIFYNNVATVQDLVSLKMSENMIEGTLRRYGDNYKWAGIADEYTEEIARANPEQPVGFLPMLNGPSEPIVQIDSTLLNNTTLANGEKEKYYVGESGTVYYKGFEYEGNTYYNKDKNVVGTNKQIEEVVVPQHTAISKTDSYVGYYAGIENTTGGIDIIGIIYADLLVGAEGLEFDGSQWSGQWADELGAYTIEKKDVSSVKEYYISEENLEEELAQYPFTTQLGERKVITPMGEGADRFYIMALSDISTSYYNWYINACNEGISDYDTITQTGFGTGKTNTSQMLDAWNSEEYGVPITESDQYADGDMWGAIETEVNKGWFVPSKEEWSAFGDAFNIDSTNYISVYGMSPCYWSSSLYTTDTAWDVYFYDGDMRNDFIFHGNYLRLAATF